MSYVKSLAITILLGLFCLSSGVLGSQRSDLRQRIFAGYDKLVQPDGQVIANVSMYVLDLGYCPHQQEMTVHAWMYLDWNDNRLKWNPEQFGGIKQISLPYSELWVPDVSFYNTNEAVSSDLTSWEKTTRVVVTSSGQVVFVPPITFKTFCAPDLDSIPEMEDTEGSSEEDSAAANAWRWAERECSIKVGSWTSHLGDVDIVSGIEHMDPIDTSLFRNDRIKILGSSVERSEDTYPCCPEIYPSLKFKLRFKYVAALLKNGKMVQAP